MGSIVPGGGFSFCGFLVLAILLRGNLSLIMVHVSSLVQLGRVCCGREENLRPHGAGASVLRTHGEVMMTSP